MSPEFAALPGARRLRTWMVCAPDRAHARPTPIVRHPVDH